MTFKKLMIVTTLLTIVVTKAHMQSILDTKWIKVEKSDYNLAEGWGIDVDASGNVFWAVSTNDLNQGLDIKCYKFDANGNEVWLEPSVYGGPGTQHAYVATADDSDLYIGGRSCQGLINTCDMLLIKLDKDSGSLIWDKTLNFSGDGYDEIDGLELREDGIYCGGWAQELESGIYQSDIGLVKFGYDGNVEWTNYLGNNETAEHQDGHFVVDDDYIFGAGLWGGTGLANLYNGYSFLGKFSKEDGGIVDSTLFGSKSDSFLDIENALGMASDGDFLYITGYTTPIDGNDWQIIVAKFDKELQMVWQLNWGGSGTESARAIDVKDGIIYIAGLTESPELMIGGGKRDGVLLKIDVDGEMIESAIWGDTLSDSFQDLAVDQNTLYITGTSENLNANPSEKQAVIIAVNNSTVSTENNPPLESLNFNVVPNPTNGIFRVEPTYEIEHSNWTIFDWQGRVVKRFFNTPKSIYLDHAGTYYIRMEKGIQSITRRVVVMP